MTQLLQLLLEEYEKKLGLDCPWWQDEDENGRWFSLGYGIHRKDPFVYVEVMLLNSEVGEVYIWGKYTKEILSINIQDLTKENLESCFVPMVIKNKVKHLQSRSYE